MNQDDISEKYEKLTILPLTIGMFTRKFQLNEDYQWYGPSPLGGTAHFKYMKMLYEKLIVDTQVDVEVEKKSIPKLAVISLKDTPKKPLSKIAVLFADIKTENRDAVGRCIYSTLYFEAEAQYIKSIVQLSLSFMRNQENYSEITKLLLEYCQKHLHQTFPKVSNSQQYGEGGLPLKELIISIPKNIAKKEQLIETKLFTKGAWIGKYDENKNKEFEKYLASKIPRNDRGTLKKSSFVFVSTGRVHKEKIKEVAFQESFCKLYEYFLVRTTSKTVKNNEKIRRPKKLEKKITNLKKSIEKIVDSTIKSKGDNVIKKLIQSLPKNSKRNF